MSKSYKPMVRTGSDPKFYDNNLAFPTYEEALANAKDLMGRWVLVVECKAVESDEVPNYNWVTGVGLIAIERDFSREKVDALLSSV